MTVQECYEAFGGNYEEVFSRLRTDERITKFLSRVVTDGSYQLLCDSIASGNVVDWSLASTVGVATSTVSMGQAIAGGVIATVASVWNWILIAGWLSGAAAFSAFCRKGSRVFDLFGAFVCSAILVASVIVFPIATGNIQMLTPMAIGNLVVAVLGAFLFAMMEVTDRVRMAPGEW